MQSKTWLWAWAASAVLASCQCASIPDGRYAYACDSGTCYERCHNGVCSPMAGTGDGGTPDAGPPADAGHDGGHVDGGGDAGADAGSCVPTTCGVDFCGTANLCTGPLHQCTCTLGKQCGTDLRCRLPEICTGAWCWERPLPQGNTLTAVSGSASDDVWIVGEHGTALHWDGGFWSNGTPLLDAGIFAQFMQTDFTGVWVGGTNVAWAVGNLPDAGGIAWFWNGTGWTPHPVTVSLSGVGGFQSTEWAVGPSLAVQLSNTSVTVIGPSEAAQAVWVAPDLQAWAVGNISGIGLTTIYQADAGWYVYAGGGALVAVWGQPSGDPSLDGGLWAVTSSGALLTWADGGTAGGPGWRNDNTANMTAAGLWGELAGPVWVVGQDAGAAAIAQWTPSNNAVAPAPIFGATLPPLRAVWGKGTDIWAVGEQGAIAHFNGGWTTFSTGSGSTDLVGIAGTTADDIWAVNDGGQVLHRTVDGGWSAPVNVIGPTPFMGIAARDAGDYWAVGPGSATSSGPMVMHCTGPSCTWVRQAVSPTMDSDLNSVWAGAFNGGLEVLVTSGQTLYALDGTNWRTVGPSPDPAHIRFNRAVAGIYETAQFWDPTGVNPAGVYQLQMGSWMNVSLSSLGLTGTLMQGAWGANSLTLEVTNRGEFLGSDNLWHALLRPTPPPQPLYGVWADLSQSTTTFSGFGWAVGANGDAWWTQASVFGFTFLSWAREPTPTHALLREVWGDSNGRECWAVGQNGVILRHTP